MYDYVNKRMNPMRALLMLILFVVVIAHSLEI